MRITCEISTKDRYDVLSQALLSLALQTHKDFDLIIFDDTDSPVDLRNLVPYHAVFQLFNQYGIGWQVVFGRKRGQHHNHQWAQELAKTDWIFRFDDDEVLEPDVLGKLIGNVRDDVGAVAGLVLPPAPSPVPVGAANIISDLNRPNLQWFRWNEPVGLPEGASWTPVKSPLPVKVEHLHSTFLYRRGIAKYELSLSPAAHREETIFTHEIYRAGYKLLIDPLAWTWHFRSEQGGIRSHRNPEFYDQDEKLFHAKLQEWGVNCERTKTIVIDAGRGDHVIVKSLIPRLKEKYGKLVVATCFPDIFNGEVEQISIAEAKNRLGNIERFSIYRWCIENNWTGNLVTAHEKLYALE